MYRSVRSAFLEKAETEITKTWEKDMRERIQYLELLKNLELKKTEPESKLQSESLQNYSNI